MELEEDDGPKKHMPVLPSLLPGSACVIRCWMRMLLSPVGGYSSTPMGQVERSDSGRFTSLSLLRPSQLVSQVRPWKLPTERRPCGSTYGTPSVTLPVRCPSMKKS